MYAETQIRTAQTLLASHIHCYFNGAPARVVAIHVGLLLAIGCVIVYGAIFYAITTFFLKKHLNLE